MLKFNNDVIQILIKGSLFAVRILEEPYVMGDYQFLGGKEKMLGRPEMVVFEDEGSNSNSLW